MATWPQLRQKNVSFPVDPLGMLWSPSISMAPIQLPRVGGFAPHCPIPTLWTTSVSRQSKG